jgi:hypothetical protein
MSSTVAQLAAARRPARTAPRARRSWSAQQLIASLGALSLVAAGSFVAVATSAAGSAQPLEWTRVDWSLVGRHSQTCLHGPLGPSTIGCLLNPGTAPVPAAAVTPAVAEPPKIQPVYSTATVTDQPAAPPVKRPAKPAAAHAAAPPAPARPLPAASAAPAPVASPRPHEPGDD